MFYFIHNIFDVKANRSRRTPEEVDKVRTLLTEFNYPNKVVIERENVGEDLGAYHFFFNLFKEKYEYFFFLNEAATLVSDNWLKPFLDCYQDNLDVVARGPIILRNTRLPEHKYVICFTFWSLRTSFGKEMIWPAPTNRFESKAQEMELIWNQANSKGFKIAQVGTGTSLLKYNICNTDSVGVGLY